ncbi:hypothetical protein MNB_SV-5-1581 [hydrothermal vent metagenome]|uniref:Uncharacterized protein n=1 Tax=hydrothermal vent metagenome TaxID=652676 RepID=A0A1W1EF10_9ZZZZ
MKKTILLVGLAFVGTSLFAVGTQKQDMPTSEMIKQNKQIVKLASQEISKTLPQKVDDYTTLQRVEGKDTTLTYVFEINTGSKSDEAVIKDDTERMKKVVTRGVCKSSKRFLDAQINVSYIYNSAISKKKLFQFDISKKDCLFKH